MLRSALALLSMLQVGGRFRQSFDRLLQQALIVLVAVAFIVAAAAFGVLAAISRTGDNLSPARSRASDGPWAVVQLLRSSLYNFRFKDQLQVNTCSLLGALGMYSSP